MDLNTFFDHLVHRELKGFFITSNIGIMFGVLLFFIIQWQEALKREKKLTEEKLIFQYETLKNQVNPHFLFNSLNTLSSLVSSSSIQAEQFIGKLSSIYRYVLENRDKDFISLDEELVFVKNYYYLQKIRDEDKIKMNVEIDNADQYLVLPLSLQILVENALKHNISTRKKPLVINILMDHKEYVTVSNHLQLKQQIDVSSRVGLNNLSERVRLSMGKELEISEDHESFQVRIPLKKK